MREAPTILMVPGLRGEVPEHWQSILEDELPDTRCVPRLGKTLSLQSWVDALDFSLTAIRGEVVVVAHSAGVIMLAHWARMYSREIRGALLATPPDLELALPAGYPSLPELRINGWLPTPRERLPFPSIVAASANDPLGSLENARSLADCWGSQFVNVGEVGHLNPASGYGRWARAHEFIGELSVARG